jgi:hypothetical protein
LRVLNLKAIPLLSDIVQIEHLNCPIWIYDISLKQISWANDPALNLWEATSLDELLKRDFNDEQSRAVDETLQGYFK